MPALPEEDDPVIASYDVFITPEHYQDPDQGEQRVDQDRSRLYVLQYPAHRPASKPYNTRRSQKPTALRIKPTTGVFELDVPLLTSENYNGELGAKFGETLKARPSSPTLKRSYGLASGFSTAAPAATNLRDIPAYGEQPERQFLTSQVLGGKLNATTEQEPVYMLGSLNHTSQTLCLSHLDGLIQLRPQLHHIDAQDAAKKAQENAARAGIRGPQALNADGTVKLETRAVEMKVKDASKEDSRDRTMGTTAKLLRDIAGEGWIEYEWTDCKEDGLPRSLVHQMDTASLTKLKATMDNEEWLNRMSTPGIELRARLKGRDRERARRKRQERIRARKAEAGAGATAKDKGPFVESEESEDSDLSDVDEGDIDMTEIDAEIEAEEIQRQPEKIAEVEHDKVGPVVKIKQEKTEDPPPPPAVDDDIKHVTVDTPEASASSPSAKRRGRPPKTSK